MGGPDTGSVRAPLLGAAESDKVIAAEVAQMIANAV